MDTVGWMDVEETQHLNNERKAFETSILSSNVVEALIKGEDGHHNVREELDILDELLRWYPSLFSLVESFKC